MNGFPILPPLVTNEITTEIQYYKQLAIAVEERIKILETMEKDKQACNKNRLAVHISDNVASTDLIFNSEIDNVKQSMTSIESIMVDYQTKDKINENLNDINTSIYEKTKSNSIIDKEIISEQKKKTLQQVNKLFSDNDKSCLNETLLCNSVSSDTISISTDLNQYLNTSTSPKTNNTDTTDTTSENWKPQVPVTLDVVPITVNKLKPSNKTNFFNKETPRLVRRGSYVLDTPSPMLLAFMHNECTNRETNMSPSSTLSIRCKEWNANKIKTNWKKQNNFKEPTFFHLNSVSKFKKGYYTNIPHRICRSVSNSKTCSPLDVYQPAKSVDCIQAMFIKEFYSPKTANGKCSNQTKINSLSFNGINGFRKHGSKKVIKNTSILNLANKLNGSLGSLSNINSKSLKRIEKKNNSDLKKNFNCNCTKSNLEEENFFFPIKKKPIVTSKKIITVFKEIQDTHKKQMIELMTRQQKEQIIMQENFKKQQILLLAQIRKAFPEISISALSEAITAKNENHNNIPLNLKIINEGSDFEKQKEFKKSEVNEINYKKDECTDIKSTMNYTHQPKELLSTSCHLTYETATPTACSIYEKHYQANQTSIDSSIFKSRIQLPYIKTIDDIPVGSTICRYSNVSRQLFPIDNKLIREPVLDNFVYTEKHIQATRIINAYAKGFLVRRLMKTEKVIALKNTYKEALHCMLRLHVDEPLQVPEIRFKKRLQQQCDAASMNIVDLFSLNPIKQMEIIAHDREIKTARSDRPSSAHSYSFATQCTLARKKLKEMGVCPGLQSSMMSKSCPIRTRCQTWTSNSKEKKITNSFINQGMKRSTSVGAVRKPWR